MLCGVVVKLKEIRRREAKVRSGEERDAGIVSLSTGRVLGVGGRIGGQWVSWCWLQGLRTAEGKS
jgi:hypothetical protein